MPDLFYLSWARNPIKHNLWWPTLIFENWKTAALSGAMCDTELLDVPTRTLTTKQDIAKYKKGPKVRIYNCKNTNYVNLLCVNLVPKDAALGRNTTSKTALHQVYFVAHFLGCSGDDVSWSRVHLDQMVNYEDVAKDKFSWLSSTIGPKDRVQLLQAMKEAAVILDDETITPEALLEEMASEVKKSKGVGDCTNRDGDEDATQEWFDDWCDATQSQTQMSQMHVAAEDQKENVHPSSTSVKKSETDKMSNKPPSTLLPESIMTKYSEIELFQPPGKAKTLTSPSSMKRELSNNSDIKNHLTQKSSLKKQKVVAGERDATVLEVAIADLVDTHNHQMMEERKIKSTEEESPAGIQVEGMQKAKTKADGAVPKQDENHDGGKKADQCTTEEPIHGLKLGSSKDVLHNDDDTRIAELLSTVVENNGVQDQNKEQRTINNDTASKDGGGILDRSSNQSLYSQAKENDHQSEIDEHDKNEVDPAIILRRNDTSSVSQTIFGDEKVEDDHNVKDAIDDKCNEPDKSSSQIYESEYISSTMETECSEDVTQNTATCYFTQQEEDISIGPDDNESDIDEYNDTKDVKGKQIQNSITESSSSCLERKPSQPKPNENDVCNNDAQPAADKKRSRAPSSESFEINLDDQGSLLHIETPLKEPGSSLLRDSFMTQDCDNDSGDEDESIVARPLTQG